MSKRPHLALEYSGKATKIHQRAFGNDHPITARSLELLATVYAEIGKTEYTKSLGECVSTLSKRFSATESFSDALSSISHSHKDRHAELRCRKEPYIEQETPKTKVINEKLPTSILKRSHVETDSSRKRKKSERRVRFREPEITVHVYDTPQSHLHLALLTCLFLLLSALGLALYCTDRRRPQRACEDLHTALAVYLLQFKQIVWACWIWLTMQ
ncbi:nutritionally-regulated adipose and cardiac-enriched protein-like isoform X2 [Carassius carassius]|uniref:nutritionally-regulated adipose and cardiac-enriched protein-like isoform X2 n=1 Tax=Carassius carassius TaxID=217509 RepID=UPI0028694713|nr:nutritionally-regulated adipose and cardiac-enriched protein-like isoform X2 [Carassius carassius]